VRDYFDLFCIIQKYDFSIEDLRMMAKRKFDWDVDPLGLASRFHEVERHLDDPILVKDIDRKELVRFFQKAAIGFKKQIVE
jgi:hypothetical protein